MIQKISSLHTRLRQFADNLVDDEMRIYKELGVDIPHRWHAILQILNEEETGLTITDLANIQDKTHPDVVYTINQMQKNGLIVESEDSKDKRKRIINSSDYAKDLIEQLKPAWNAVQEATNQWVREIAPDLWLNIEALNSSLEKKSFFQRIKQEKKRYELRQAQVMDFGMDPNGQLVIEKFWSQFKSKYFMITELDPFIFNIQDSIIRNGGRVLFAHWNQDIIGCICLIRRSFNFAEVVHLWVDESFRRRYIGMKLLDKIVQTGKEIGTQVLYIQSHPKLVAANTLFQQAGFVTTDQFPKSFEHYPKMPITLMKQIV